jgi:hypothetical protein
MKRPLLLACLVAMAALQFPHAASAQRADYEALVAAHASANGVPADLVHRVIVRESRYQPKLIGRGGTIGLMQIKLATARGLGYSGDAEGLRDPNTNLAYGVKYLAGAYRAANGDHARAIPQAEDFVSRSLDRGDPLNLIRVMPAKGQGCTRVQKPRGGIRPYPSSAQALPAPGRRCCSRRPATPSRCTSAATRR